MQADLLYPGLLVGGLLMLMTYTEAAECNCKCPLDYSPVCAAGSRGNEETYPNQCSFECYKCTHGKQDLRILRRTECSEMPNKVPQNPSASTCNCNCSLNYAAVCAVDSKGEEETYPNECVFECYRCTQGEDLRILKQGECTPKRRPLLRRPSAKLCNCKCPLSYAPVCVVDSKGVEETYPSACSFECYKCTHGKDLQIRRQGECSKKVVSQPPRQENNVNKQKTANGKCNCQCPYNNAPVCAVDSKGNDETFPNQCALECYKCTHEKVYTIRKKGECAGSTSGRDNARTPDNIKSIGSTREKCHCQCGRNYDPVCAVEPSKTVESFGNKCLFECHSCTSEKVFVVWKQGECVNKATGRRVIDTQSFSKCKCGCTSDYAPLCAVNSLGSQQTFPNRCAMECSNCIKNEDFVFRRQGQCNRATASTHPARLRNRTAWHRR